MLLDRHRLLDVVTGGGDIAERQKSDSCTPFSNGCPPADSSDSNPWTRNVMPFDFLNTPSVDFHISILRLLMQVLLLKNTCTSAFGVNKLDVLTQLSVEIQLHYSLKHCRSKWPQ